MYEQTTKTLGSVPQYAGSDARVVREASVLGDATVSVAASANRVHHLIGIVREFADTTLGSTPQAAPQETTGKRAVGSRADSLRNEITGLYEALTDLENEVARLHLI